jgi:hypothetical protein
VRWIGWLHYWPGHGASPCERSTREQENFGVTSSQRLRASALIALALSPLGAGVATAQEAEGEAKDGVRWFLPAEPFAPLIADPWETQIRGSIVSAKLNLGGLEGADPEAVELLEKWNTQAEVALAYRQNIVQFQRETESRPAIAIGFEVGVFSRFLLETSQKDFMSADFRVGLPFQITWSGWEGRFEILHMSSHFGDDLFDRLGLVNEQVTFDGIQLIAARRLIPAVRLYAGGNFNFHSNPGVEEISVQWGLEWDKSEIARDGHVFPLFAANFRITDETDRVAGTALAGATFRISGVRLQLALRGHFGPSPIGKFRNHDENFIGLGLRFLP